MNATVEFVPELPKGASIATALAKAQARFSNIKKDREVEVKSDKGRYTFRYATLAAIWDVIRTPLAEAGIAVVQVPKTRFLDDAVKGVEVTVETRLLHTSGESIVADLMLVTQKRDPQGIGAVISYAKRYHLGALLGIASDDETDIDDSAQQAGPPVSVSAPSAGNGTSSTTGSGPAFVDPPVPVDISALAKELQDAPTEAALKEVSTRIGAMKGLSLPSRKGLADIVIKRTAEFQKGKQTELKVAPATKAEAQAENPPF
jgi:hypothetical protein